jgi:ElaB/YqjD/DUF883 family membrane-anchored ribosome-binding protein
VLQEKFSAAEIAESVKRWKAAYDAAESQASASAAAIDSRDSVIETLTVENEQLKSQAQSAQIEYREVQASLEDYLKVMESTALEVRRSYKSRTSDIPIFAAEFLRAYPYKYAAPRSSLPVVDRYINTQNALNVVHARRNITDAFNRSSDPGLAVLIAGLKACTSHLLDPEGSEETENPREVE